MKVWTQLAEIFGRAFYREHSDTPPRLWVQAISRLSDKQIANGLAKLANANMEFPANLSQFVAACKIPAQAPHWDSYSLPPPSAIERQKEVDKAWEQLERYGAKRPKGE